MDDEGRREEREGIAACHFFTLAGEGPVGEKALIRFEARGYGIPEPPDAGPDWLRGVFHAEAVPGPARSRGRRSRKSWRGSRRK